MTKTCILFIVLLHVLHSAMCQPSAGSFEIKNGSFLLNGKPFVIRSGEMHYPRIPEPYWRHRIKMAKAMGLNTIAVYCFWNFHNPEPGIWDFNSERHNVARFIKLCKEENMMVILRPGPYVCAEWDFGGYPWWLLKDTSIVIRNNQRFIDSCRIYIQHLAGELRDLQITRGGPIIMVQAENEFGSYMAQQKDISRDEHLKYYHSILNLLKEAGFEVPFFTSDGDWLFKDGAMPGILPAANGEEDVENLKKSVDRYYPGGPYMVAEFYPGWLDHWAEPFIRVSKDKTTAILENFLKNNVSFSIYMAHGGTNFGFSSGANYNEEHSLQPDITSYDYDAPISEQGSATEKYFAIRNAIIQHSDSLLPSLPAPVPVVKLPDIELIKKCDFLSQAVLEPSIYEKLPLSFEDLNQGYGYVIYSLLFAHPVKGMLEVPGIRDFATVYVNGHFAGELNRVLNISKIFVDIPEHGQLDILVENLGRINYGAQIPFNKKGIISPVKIGNDTLAGPWNIRKFPFRTPFHFSELEKPVTLRPVFYEGSFDVKEPADTYLDMRGWGKGIVFVNGKNLGRYWQIGPQQTLYLPGCWLNKGKNTVYIFEQLNIHPQTVIKTTDKPVLDELKL